MEVAKLSYSEIMEMPYTFFVEYVNWKTDFEKERRKKNEETNKTIQIKKDNEARRRKHRLEQEKRRHTRNK